MKEENREMQILKIVIEQYRKLVNELIKIIKEK